MVAYLIVGRTAVPVLGLDLDHGAQAGRVLGSVNSFDIDVLLILLYLLGLPVWQFF